MTITETAVKYLITQKRIFVYRHNWRVRVLILVSENRRIVHAHKVTNVALQCVAISIRLSNVGCEVFVTHLEIVAVSLPNISPSSLFETMRSAITTLIRFNGLLSIYIIYIKLLVQKYDFLLEKPLISARIYHFPCKIIDFLINFHYFLVYLHVISMTIPKISWQNWMRLTN